MSDDRDALIERIYEGAVDKTAWEAALAGVACLVNAAGAAFGMQDMRTHVYRPYGAYGVDLSLRETYRKLARGNRLWQEIWRRREPLIDRMVMSRMDIQRAPLFAEWLAPQGFCAVMACPALFDGSACAVISAFRNGSQGEFDERDLATIERLSGHFGRALRFRLDRKRAEEEIAADNAMLDDVPDALFLVDRGLRLRRANAAGRRLLAASGNVRLRGGRLALRDAAAEAWLKQFVADGRVGETPLASGWGARLLVKLHPQGGQIDDPDGGVVFVRISDPQTNPIR